jgi:hypothetical protein
VRENLNFNTLFNTVAMVRSEIQKLILIVEGDDDFHLLDHHASDDAVLMPGQGGKPHVLTAAALVEHHSIGRVCFLVDRDFDTYTLTSDPYPANVISSSRHDFFMDIVDAAAYVVDVVVSIHARRMGRRGGVIDAASMRVEALALASKIAPFRIVNDKLGLGLNFRDFPFGNFSTINPTSLDISKLIVGRSNTEWTSEQLSSLVDDECPSIIGEPIDLVGDHDFFRALSRVLYEHGMRRITADDLFNSFLSNLSSNCDALRATNWHRAVEDWADAHDSSATSCPCNLAA